MTGDRQLARYRSIQHMFPGVYGIGPDGVESSEAPVWASAGGASRIATSTTKRDATRLLVLDAYEGLTA